MTREQAKDKIMQLYGSLSEDMKQAIDTLMDVPVDMIPLAVKAETMKAYRELTGDYVSRKAVLDKAYAYGNGPEPDGYCVEVEDIQSLPPANPDLSEYSDKLYKLAYERGKAEGQEQKTGRCKDCKWWKDSDGVYRRGIGAESQCAINSKVVFEGNGYCYMYKPKESEGE